MVEVIGFRREGIEMSSCRPFHLIALVALVLPSFSRAESTIELQVGPLNGVTAARGILVADGAGDGFVDPGPWMVGGALAPGATLGGSDDTIVAVFGTNGGLPWSNGTGFGVVLPGINFADMGLSPGTDLRLCWIVGDDDGPSELVPGSVITCLTETSFLVPEDGQTTGLSFLGNTNSNIVSGPVSSALELSLNEMTSAQLGAGETVFYVFDASVGQRMTLDVHGDPDVRAEVLDSNGNSLGEVDGIPMEFENGRYFLALRSESGDDVEFALRSGGYQPDLWVTGRYRRARRNNVYSNNPGAQIYRVTLRTRAVLPLVVQNDSEIADSFRVNASRIHRSLREAIFDRRRNVSGLIATGRYRTSGLASGQARLLSVRVSSRPTQRVTRRSRILRAGQNFYATSTSDFSERDSVRVLFSTRR